MVFVCGDCDEADGNQVTIDMRNMWIFMDGVTGRWYPLVLHMWCLNIHTINGLQTFFFVFQWFANPHIIPGLLLINMELLPINMELLVITLELLAINTELFWSYYLNNSNILRVIGDITITPRRKKARREQNKVVCINDI